MPSRPRHTRHTAVWFREEPPADPDSEEMDEVEYEVEFTATPGEPAVHHYSDGSGHPGAPAEVEVTEVWEVVYLPTRPGEYRPRRIRWRHRDDLLSARGEVAEEMDAACWEQLAQDDDGETDALADWKHDLWKDEQMEVGNG